ncbi:hypothetical protein WME85_01665 [Sorangium sp. So ce1153]
MVASLKRPRCGPSSYELPCTKRIEAPARAALSRAAASISGDGSTAVTEPACDAKSIARKPGPVPRSSTLASRLTPTSSATRRPRSFG